MTSVRFVRTASAGLVVSLIVWGIVLIQRRPPSLHAAASKLDDPPKMKAPELDGGVAWLNTAGPLSITKKSMATPVRGHNSVVVFALP